MCDFQCPQKRHNVCFKTQHVCPVLLRADSHKSHFCLKSLLGKKVWRTSSAALICFFVFVSWVCCYNLLCLGKTCKCILQFQTQKYCYCVLFLEESIS